MEKLKDLWVNDGELTSDSERLTPFDLNQIILIKQMDELAEVLSKLYKERKALS